MTQEIVRRKRRPWLAVILALLGPGCGHLYSGRIWWAIAWLVTFLVALNLAYLLMIHWDAKPFNIIVPLGGLFLFALFHIFHAGRTAYRQSQEFALRPYNRWYCYVLWLLIVFLVFGYTGPIYGNYDAYYTPSQAMESSLYIGDRFYADLSAYHTESPSRGDVVIFIFPRDGVTLYIKRCVAIPGDTVEIVNKKLFINGSPAIEPTTKQFTDTTATGESIVLPRQHSGVNSRDNFGPIVVPESNFFMLGDNRDNSFDSRFWGTVPRDMILGKAVRIYYSPDWSRIGLKIE